MLSTIHRYRETVTRGIAAAAAVIAPSAWMLETLRLNYTRPRQHGAFTCAKSDA